MIDIQKVLKLTRNKTRRVMLVLNEELWELYKNCAKDEENKNATQKLEELIIDYLDKMKKI